MPVNRNALIRYKTIDKCLQNRYRRWTLDDLIDAVSDALYEYEGIRKGIGRRTVQLDIQMMRSDKLGYNAPIIVYDNKFYTYEDENYSITNIPITDQDLGQLSEAVEFLKQFKGFNHFKELDGMVQKLEDHVYSQKNHQPAVIDFEKNENLKGLNFLDCLYKAIIQRKIIMVTYQSFKARHANSFQYTPYLLKEFRNRWFLIGLKEKNQVLMTLALDRIVDVAITDTLFEYPTDFDFKAYFKNAIGVSVSPSVKTEKVVLFVTRKHAPYILTKPLHSSQKLIEKDSFGITIELNVQLNFELEKDILAFGEAVMVLEPQRLRRSVRERLESAVENYNTTLTDKGSLSMSRKLQHKGFVTINNLLSQKAIKHLNSHLNKSGFLVDGTSIDLDVIPAIKDVLFNKNIYFLSKLLFEGMEVESITYCESFPEFSAWSQADDNTVFFFIMIGFKHSEYLEFELLPGTHKKKMSNELIETITENSLPATVELYNSGGFICNGQLVKRILPIPNGRRNRCIVIRYRKTEEIEIA